MKLKRINIKDIPYDFVINNITPQKIDALEVKYSILNKYLELKNKHKEYTQFDICLIISEDVGLQPETIRLLLLKMHK